MKGRSSSHDAPPLVEAGRDGEPYASGRFAISRAGRGHEILNALGTAVVVVNAEGRIELANHRALAVLRTSPTALLGNEVGRVLAPFEVIRRAAESDGDEARQSLTLPDSAQVVIGFRVQKLSSDGSDSFVISFQDITQWERLREERDRLMRLAAVSEVLPSVLHELKNPLAAIGTAIELLVEDCVEPEFRERLHSVLPELRRMSLTLEGIGSVGRELRCVRAGAVDHALRESFVVLERQARERGIAFTCKVQDMPLLPFDVAMIRAIAFNLLTNAIHACSPGKSIELSATFTRGEASELAITVADTGTGMTTEVAGRCRELFFTTKSRGTGIGLALCDRAATEAGGRLEVESVLGRGTKVTLKVPVRPPTHRGVTHTRS
jgi:signal transduction histidine kinase